MVDFKPYRGQDVRNGVERARQEPGPDAHILHVHRMVSGASGVRPEHPETEVLAVDRSAHSTVGSPYASTTVQGLGHLFGEHRTTGLLRQPILHAAPALSRKPFSPSSLPPHALRAHFRRIGMDESLIDQMVKFPDRTSSAMQDQHFVKVIRRLVKTGASIPEAGRVVVSFVGPTGVGKSTSIAKLAGRFADQGRAVSLITTDTFRVGAVEQLDACARKIEAPLRIVYTRSDFIAALDASHGADVVLIDTPGISPYDSTMLEELRSLVGYPDRVMCYLTLPASYDQHEAIEASRRFARIDPAALLLTKLDETRRYGTMFNVAVGCDLPLGYLATGSSVQGDLHVATPRLLLDYILPQQGTAES